MYQNIVDVLAAKMWITACSQHRKHLVAYGHYGYVEGATAEIVD